MTTNYPEDGDDCKRIRKVVISAPHPSYFQKERIQEAIMNGDVDVETS